MSVRLGICLYLLHILNKLLKQIAAVLRSGCTFRVILHTENAVLLTADTFYGMVKQIHMGHAKSRSFKAIQIYGIAVVLGGNFNVTGF